MAYTFIHGDRPLDGYTIQRGVGRGGFGEVYYALSDGGKEVALKYLRENPTVELRGIANCLNLKSPHLVSIYDVRQSPAGEHFIVMEHVAGPSLRELMIGEPKGLGVQKAAYFLREVGKGLAFLHDRAIVHRDLKPGNILCDDGHVKIGDYGLSKFIAVSRHSVQTSSVGTVHYMAPEIGSGQYSRGVDIYALGVILYEMLLGRVPFEGSSMGEVLMKHLTAQPEVDDLPAPFPQVIRKALAKDPNDRYQNIQDMIAAVFAREDLERSVSSFGPASLTMAAAAAARHARFDMDAPSPVFAAPADDLRRRDAGSGPARSWPVPLGHARLNVNHSGLGPNSTRPGEVEQDTPEQRKMRRMGVAFMIATFFTMCAPAIIVTARAVDGRRIDGGAIAAIVSAASVSMAMLATSIVFFVKGRVRRPHLTMPLQRTMAIARRPDLGDLLTRYFVSLGYHPSNKDPLLWGFERGSRSGEAWSCDIRKYRTRLTVAAYESPEGYLLTCHLDVENPWGWYSRKEREILASELDGLAELLAALPVSAGSILAREARVEAGAV